MTSIYFACFHSDKPKRLSGSGSFLTVETAISRGEWPYDNGDDPSFYVARQGGPLTWGVCRQDLRNSITKGSVVVFFSFTTLATGEILYRLCAVATVEDRLDHRALQRDARLLLFRHLYSNGLITYENNGWRYDETDRSPSQRHHDWLWRIANHRGITKKRFAQKHAEVYRDGWFSDQEVVSGRLPLADNYILFSTSPDRTFISPNPPTVAIAVKGQHEQWTDRTLQSMTVGKAASLADNGRDYLRVVNKSGRNVHRQIHVTMPDHDAGTWRAALIAALTGASART
jgi:hypothetical protein